MENLLRRCVEVRITIELSFGVVSGVDPGIHVPQGEGSVSGMVLWHFSASGHEFVSIGIITLRNAFDSFVKS